MKFLFLFLFSTLLLSADYSLEELKGLTGADFLLPKYHENLTGKELQDYLNLESSFSGLKRMTKAEWEAIPKDKSEISTFSNNSADLSGNMPAVDSQGQKGSCAAWSGGYYLKSYYENKERGKSSANRMSPAFIYNHRNGASNSPCERDAGMKLSTVANILKFKGTASWSSMTYSGTKLVCPQPSTTQINNAWQYRIDSYKTVYGVSSFRTELDKGNPIYIGIAVSVYFSRASFGWANSSWARNNPQAWNGGILTSMPRGKTDISCSANNPCSNNGGDGLQCVSGKCEEVGAHGIVITGYDKNDDTFTIVNSWGTSWGTNGYLKIQTNVLEKMLSNYQGVRGIVYKDHVEAHPSSCSTVGEETCSGSTILVCKSINNSLQYTTRSSCGQGWSCDASNLNDSDTSNDCLKGDGGTGCENPNSLSDTNSSAGLLSILFIFFLFFIRRKKNI